MKNLERSCPKAVEGGGEEAYGHAAPVYRSLTARLSSTHASYLLHWLDCVALEERESTHLAREMAALSGVERERVGRAISDLELIAIQRRSGAESRAWSPEPGGRPRPG